VLASTNATAVLDREFLAIRSRLVDLAAALDRVQRGSGSAAEDPRMVKILRSLEVVRQDQLGRAEQVQMIFSLPYNPQWQGQFAKEGR
jgi:hypothetical protein